jgi:hypothetical protein
VPGNPEPMQPTHMQAQKRIDGVEFPADRGRLVEYARGHGADPELLEVMIRLPDRVYRDPNEVGAAFARVSGE